MTGRRHRTAVPGRDRAGVAILGCRHHRAVGAPAGLRAVRRGGDRRLEPDAGDHGRRCASGSRSSGRVYASAEELLADPEVRYVDLATGPEGRLDWIEAAVEAGKHVLAQKPLTLSADDLARLPASWSAPTRPACGSRSTTTAAGRRRGARRRCWSASGAIGEVVGVTHLHDKPLPPLAGTPFDDVPHMLLTDYLLHWVDITRDLAGRRRRRAGDLGAGGRLAGARPAGRGPQPVVGDAVDDHRAGATATLRIAGSNVRLRAGLPVLGARHRAAPCAAACCSTPTGSSSTTARRAPRCALTGAWFVDGFAATMGELMCAVAEDREPENSAADAARSVAAGPRRPRRPPSGAATPVEVRR